MKILISSETISAKLKQTGDYISKKYKDGNLLLVGILKGSFVFLADLARNITIPCEIGFMGTQSYIGTHSSGEVRITLDLQQNIADYNVVVAEDIIDSGNTLKAIADILRARNPKSLEIITLLDKPDRRETDIQADRVLFTISDEFVVGYGLDYNEKYRNLPYIAIIEE